MKLIDKIQRKIDKDYLSSKEVEEARMNTCLECPRLYRPTMQCKECGCFVKAKTKVKSAACPLQKW